MTASRVVTRARLVVVRSLATVVPQVERGLDGRVGVLGASRVLGVVAGRPPVGIHVVHRSVSPRESDRGCRVWPSPPRDGGRTDSWIPRGKTCAGSGSRWVERGFRAAVASRPGAGIQQSEKPRATPTTAARWPLVRPRRGAR